MEKIVGKYKIKILEDANLNSPREDPNVKLGIMVCFHKRYNLGDAHTWNHSAFDGWDEFRKQLEKTFKIAVILPLYLYDHSGITMNTTGFSCRWDSGQVGFIYATKETVRETFCKKRISKKLAERVKTDLINEVDEYNTYLNGDGFRFEIWKLKNGEDHELIDSCGGYFKYDDCLTDAEDSVPPQPEDTQLEIPFEKES